MFIGDVKMNKSERLNDMMIYLNNKSYFNLTDLMEKYNISRSTAIRDVQSLECQYFRNMAGMEDMEF